MRHAPWTHMPMFNTLILVDWVLEFQTHVCRGEIFLENDYQVRKESAHSHIPSYPKTNSFFLLLPLTETRQIKVLLSQRRRSPGLLPFHPETSTGLDRAEN